MDRKTDTLSVLFADMNFDDKAVARRFFHQITQVTRDWNRIEMDNDDFKKTEKKLLDMISEVSKDA